MDTFAKKTRWLMKKSQQAEKLEKHLNNKVKKTPGSPDRFIVKQGDNNELLVHKVSRVNGFFGVEEIITETKAVPEEEVKSSLKRD